ncbi:DUF3499 family protein [Leucobacter sp. W1478]|uniref:DUF3499 family protein n=1 Tax=Leucobacter sp. W1478 TaxID=3439065 RepID=UPI003F3CFD08
MTAEDPHRLLEPDAYEAASIARERVSGVDQAPADRATADCDSTETSARLCARVSCGAPAVATLTADYADRMMAVGPLSPLRTPPALDLCPRHRDALSPPDGWELIVHRVA